MAWQPLVFFYKRSKRPFYFPKKKPRFIRFSGQAFAFDYNFIGRFFYVLLEVGLKNQAAYRVPNFLQSKEALFSGNKLPFLQGDIFLYRTSYLFFTLFSKGGPLGYFPINFYNSIFLNGGFSKHTFTQQSLWSKRALFKSTMQRVRVAVDSHLSLFFSGKAIFFPKLTNYIATFKYAMGQVYLISGDHNVSFYTWRAEGSSSKFGAVSFRRYRDFFFENFFKELQIFFLSRFFSFAQGCSVRSYVLLDFYFGHFYRIVNGMLKYLCYLKLLVGSFFFFFHCFISFKNFLFELFYLVVLLAKVNSLYLFSRLSFFRSFFFVVIRSFFFSGVFKGMCIAPLRRRHPKALLTGDLAFFRGLCLHTKISSSLYRKSTSKVLFGKKKVTTSRVKLLRCWVDTIGKVQKKKRKRWIDYIYRYFYRKKKKVRWARYLKRYSRLVFPNYIYTFYKDEGDPEEVISRMEVSFHKCFFRSATSYGRSLFPFFPMGRSYASYGVHSRRDHAWNSASFFFDNEKNAPRRVFKETIKSPRVIASTETISHLDSGSEVVAEEGTPFFSSSHAFRALNPQGFKSRYSLQHCRYSFFKSFKARRLAPWGFNFRKFSSLKLQPLHNHVLDSNVQSKVFFFRKSSFMRRKVMQPRKLSLKFLALANAKARRRRGYKSLVVAKRAKASKSKPLYFVFLKRALFRFLLFFFGRRAGHLNGNVQFSKCIYRLRRSIFFKLRHILLKKKRGFFLGKRLCISKKTFIFPLGSLVNKILLGKVRRRRLSVRKLFLMQRKKFSFKGYYGFTFFLNGCLAPFIFYKGKISKSKVLAFFFLHYARATEWLFLGRVYGRFLLKFSGSYLSVYFITALAWVLPLARSVVSFFFKYRRAIVRRGYPLFAKRKKRALEGIYFSMRGLQRFYRLCLFFKRDFLRGRLAVGFLPKIVVRKGYLPFQIKGKSRPKNGLSDLKKPLRADSRVKSFRSVSTMQLGVRPVDVPGVGARQESSPTLLKPGVVSTDAWQPPQEKVYRRPLWLFRHVYNKGGRFRPRSRRRNASRS